MNLHLAALAGLFVASASQAATLTTDRAVFDAATAGLPPAIKTFDAVGPIDAAEVDLGAFVLRSTDLLDDVLGPSFCLVPNCVAATGDATFAFDADQNAFGILIGGLGDKTLSIFLDGALVGEAFAPSETFTFVGLPDAASFSTVSIVAADGAGFLLEDAIFVGAAPAPAPVPLPAALPLLLAGVAGLVALRASAGRR